MLFTYFMLAKSETITSKMRWLKAYYYHCSAASLEPVNLKLSGIITLISVRVPLQDNCGKMGVKVAGFVLKNNNVNVKQEKEKNKNKKQSSQKLKSR